MLLTLVEEVVYRVNNAIMDEHNVLIANSSYFRQFQKHRLKLLKLSISTFVSKFLNQSHWNIYTNFSQQLLQSVFGSVCTKSAIWWKPVHIPNISWKFNLCFLPLWVLFPWWDIFSTGCVQLWKLDEPSRFLHMYQIKIWDMIINCIWTSPTMSF